MLPKHVRYQAALHPARPGCRHRRWFCSRRRNISYYTCVHLSTPFFNFSEKTSLPFFLPSQRSLAPLCKGSCPASSRTEGLPHGQGQGGGLSPSPIFAPNQLFELLRCFAWLIQLRQRTALSPLKRSCFRFAPLTLRCRTEPALQAAPVFRSAYSASRNARTSAASRSSWEPHCTFSSKTLMLQVRFVRPPNPSRPAAAPINCTHQNRVSPPQGCRGRPQPPPTGIGARGRAKPFPSLHSPDSRT